MRPIPLGRPATSIDPLRIGFMVSGRGSNMVAILKACKEGLIPARPAVVLADRPDAPALAKAGELGVNAVGLDYRTAASAAEYHADVRRHLEDAGVELIVLAGYMRILPADFVHEYTHRIVNIHPSLLPSFPGLRPHEQAIAHGVKVSGATVHLVDDGVDSGPIILQRPVAVHDNDTPEDLAERILAVEHQIYPEAIALMAGGFLYLADRRVIQRDGSVPRTNGDSHQ